MSTQGHGRRAAGSRRPGRRPRRRVSVIGLIGELFITAGVLVFLFLGWQLWLNDLIVGAQQNKASAHLAQSWGGDVPSRTPAAAVDYGDPVVATAPADARSFAVIYIPRFNDPTTGAYQRTVVEGVSTTQVLDKAEVGHYPGTAMPGQVGNFAVAAHRTTHGAPFHLIASLQVGDKIYIKTQDGYYTYEFRGLEYVKPTGVGVLDPVPQQQGVAPTDRLMTMTSCNPMYSASERIIAYSVFDSWQPLSAGPPAGIAATVDAKEG